MGSGSPLALERVARIAVLSPNRIGDFMFILPALHALKHTYYSAELVLVGRDWHAGFLRGRPGPVDRVLAMPPYPGVGAPLLAPLDPRPAQRFLRRMREARFDLAVQMFGGGRYSNPLVRQFGARMAIGAKADDAPPLDRWVAFSEPNNRRLKLLEVAALAGATAPLLERELEPTDADRREAAVVLPFQPGERLAMLQPGSSDPRRCWPVAHFAAVGDALVQAGARVLINGTADEAPLVRAVMGAMRRPAVDLAGRLTVRGLCGLLERVGVMVSNDTGPLHLALAVGTPSVGIFWFTNLIGGMPLRQGQLRVGLSVRTHCPVCGAENLRTRCPHDDSFVADVPVDEVTSMATSLLRAGR